MDRHDELLILRTTVFEALQFASLGEVEEGYEVLLVGKHQALQGASGAETWLKDLQARWESALAAYQARFAVGRA